MEATKEKMCVVEAAKKRGALLMGTRSCGFIAWGLPTMGPTKVVLSYSDLLLLLIWFDVFCGDFDFFLCGDMFKSVFLFSRFCGLMFKLGFYFLGGTMVGYVKDEG